ncbi:MAG: type VI secretion protein ImpB [Sphingobium sp.]|nr:type VI secretion protein ImpB [Sphingobium sp.]MBP6111107.1 type VI secretion protein ImpB [Sphingobium sp.]MBP8670915.1 type VI secretion protein ImpB [Sphingobium sp.]MBP9157970.1 type VI secretion protein ImpB [Sphingobium sp.]MCC6482202.1 impB/mucB/samB family protein [Sphingomonadaceae bacterium]
MSQSYPSSPLKWLYVDFNSYFASVEQQEQPHLRGLPVAVVPVETESTCAIAASYEAKAFGIRTGTPIWEAKRMCRGLVCVLARHELYVDYHHRAIAEINRHIPVSEVCSIDEMASRLLRNEAQPEAARAIALSIKAGLAANLGPWVRCSIGIAANRYLAKVATDLEKPDGLTVLMPEEAEHRLIAELKPRDLPGIGRNMERRLWLNGVHTMAELMALNRRRMRHIWGSIWGERMWYLLRGHDLPELETQRRSIGHSHVLAPALRPPGEAINVARRLTMKAAARLRRMGYTATYFGFAARLEDGRKMGGEMRCRPAQDSPAFLAMLLAIWDRTIIRERGIAIKKISVVMLGLADGNSIQLSLFDTSSGKAEEKLENSPRSLRLSHALDHLNHKFGRDTVLIGMLPSAGRGFSGTKIAFTRIPDREEFLE